MSDSTADADYRAASETLARIRRQRGGASQPVAYTQGRHDALDDALALALMLGMELSRRINALEQRAAEPGMKFAGAWAPGEYAQGATVTLGGQLYFCAKKTTDRPESGSAAWVLCTRRGRDGRDADPHALLKMIEAVVDRALDARGGS
jgi:hypothetical protein